MDEQRLAEIIEEADRLYAEDPDAEYDQPPAVYAAEAQGLLAEDAPWHQIAAVAHALRAEDEGEEE